MASSLPAKTFLGVPSSDLGSLHGSDLRKFSSQKLQLSNCRSHPKKLG
ncbi:hypothetical protein Acr_18g0000070 [Actinidia rufa]|uniref:Uncharacterized protein n=1 Tax=Actinidia rufa TaxID=165716 RepID=A0A7J0G4Y9_9ERIC|nr:hypothetical protein Acr_18g0000070 [Actinidia rufa]